MKEIRQKRFCDKYMFILYIVLFFVFINMKMIVLPPATNFLTKTRLRCIIYDSIIMMFFPLILCMLLKYVPQFLITTSLYIGISMLVIWQAEFRKWMSTIILISGLLLILIIMLQDDTKESSIKIQIAVRLLYKRYNEFFIVYLVFVITMNLLQYYLICTHNLISSFIPQLLLYIIMILVLICNLLLSSAFFRYFMCNVYMCYIMNDRTSFCDIISAATKNTANNTIGIFCHVFTFEFKGSKERLRRCLSKYLALIIGYTISNAFPFLCHEQAYALPIMAMFKLCDCGYSTVKRLNKFLSKYYEYIAMSNIMFNSKGMFVSIAFCMFNMYESSDYMIDTLCLDKEALFRLYRFVALTNCIYLAHDALDAAWRSLILLYTVDRSAVERYDIKTYQIIQRWN